MFPIVRLIPSLGIVAALNPLDPSQGSRGTGWWRWATERVLQAVSFSLYWLLFSSYWGKYFVLGLLVLLGLPDVGLP